MKLAPSARAAGAAFALLLAPLAALAQALPTGTSVPSLTLSLAPQYPQPYGSLTITPESTLVNLNDATISITANGVPATLQNGSATITLPGPGTATTIRATATILGASYTASATIVPGAVALVEEPIASAPSLYPGKPLVPQGGSVRIVAVPDFETSPGAKIAPAALSYAWSVDGLASNALSGIGKQTIVVDAPLLYRTRAVSVIVQSQDGSVAGASALSLTAEQPTLRLYADDPLMGIDFDHALAGALAVTGSEATLAAVPYSFTTDYGAPSINWFLDGSAVAQGPTITLRPTGEGSGTASISATASGAQTAASAASSLSISFGSSNSGTLLGL